MFDISFIPRRMSGVILLSEPKIPHIKGDVFHDNVEFKGRITLVLADNFTSRDNIFVLQATKEKNLAKHIIRESVPTNRILQLLEGYLLPCLLLNGNPHCTVRSFAYRFLFIIKLRSSAFPFCWAVCYFSPFIFLFFFLFVCFSIFPSPVACL